MVRVPPSISIDELFRHDAFVRGLARSLVRDEHLAEDLVQDTYRAALGANAPRDKERTRGWLAGVVRNLARFQARGAARRRRREQAAARPEPSPATEELIERVDLHRRVVEASLGLDEPYRSVLLLRHFEELSHAEIAARTGVPLETMRTRLKRAHSLLRDRLERDFSGDESRLHQGLMALGTGHHALTSTVGSAVGSTVGSTVDYTVASGVASPPAGVTLLGGILMSTATRVTLLVFAFLGAVGCWYVFSESEPESAAKELRRQGAGASVASDPEQLSPTAADAPSRNALSIPTPETEQASPSSQPTFAPESSTVSSAVVGYVLDEDDEPISGSQVLLHDQSGDGLAESRPIADVRTDADGRFEFDEHEFHGRHSRASVFVISDEYAIGGATFGIPALDPIVVQLARKTGLKGRVSSTEGGPIAGARVTYDSLVLPGESGFEYFLVPDAMRDRFAVVTDASGYFYVDSLPRHRTVNLRVDASGFASWRGAIALSGASESGPQEVRLYPGASIRGSVRFADGQPVCGVRLGAQAWDEEEDIVSWAEGTTDATGCYALLGLGAGRWNVFVDLPQYAQQEWTTAAKDGVELFVGVSAEAIDFVLTGGATLTFTATEVDSGEPVEGAMVAVVSAARPRSGGAVQWVETDAFGHGSIRIPAGEVRAYMMGAPSGFEAGVGGETLTLAEGAEHAIPFELRRIPALRGRVVDTYDRPVAGARVWTLTAGIRGIAGGAKTTSDAEGWFSLEATNAGMPVTVRAETDDLGMPAPYDLSVSSGDDIRLVMQPKPTLLLQGRVLRSNGLPAAGAQVDLHEDSAGVPAGMGLFGGQPSTRTDAEGRYTFRSIWPGNHYRVTASYRDTGDSSLPDGEAWVTAATVAREAVAGAVLDLGDLVLRRDG